MTINERLFITLREKNIKPKTLADNLGVKQQIISNWEKRGTNPPIEFLPQICQVLNISWEYLVTGEEKSSMPLPQEETELLNMYRQLDPRDRKEIKGIINLKLEQRKPEGIILNSKTG